MVRPKRQLAPEKKAEVEKLLLETKGKFKMDLRELELAKRQFSTAFVGAMATELPKIFPEEVLDMRLNDFIKQLGDQAYDFNDEPDQEGTSKGATAATPAFPRRPLTYKTMRTPAGLSIKVPSCITPKVEGSMARTGKRGEVLFSVHGTPVMNTMGPDKTDAVVQDWLQQEEERLTPQTREIIVKLKELVHMRGKGNDESGGEESDGH
uniref:Borealin C-terminal domain-containing protein n=1 Tax=Globodera rostochiensis TaxID=31243 RepID=A0A914HIJ5_GLORO